MEIVFLLSFQLACLLSHFLAYSPGKRLWSTLIRSGGTCPHHWCSASQSLPAPQAEQPEAACRECRHVWLLCSDRVVTSCRWHRVLTRAALWASNPFTLSLSRLTELQPHCVACRLWSPLSPRISPSWTFPWVTPFPGFHVASSLISFGSVVRTFLVLGLCTLKNYWRFLLPGRWNRCTFPYSSC